MNEPHEAEAAEQEKTDRKPSRARDRFRRTTARYETCCECGEDWNISKQAVLPPGGYICPRCQYMKRKGESNGIIDA